MDEHTDGIAGCSGAAASPLYKSLYHLKHASKEVGYNHVIHGGKIICRLLLLLS